MRQALAEARRHAETEIDERGHLPYGARRRLLNAVDEVLASQNGRIFRTTLLFQCAEVAIPFWSLDGCDPAKSDKVKPEMKTFLRERSFKDILHDAKLLIGRWSESYDQLSLIMYDIAQCYASADISNLRIWASGLACARAVEAIAIDSKLWNEEAEYEGEVDPDMLDGAYFASIAVASSMPRSIYPELSSRSGDAARRGFWKWYLSDAFDRSLKAATTI